MLIFYQGSFCALFPTPAGAPPTGAWLRLLPRLSPLLPIFLPVSPALPAEEIPRNARAFDWIFDLGRGWVGWDADGFSLTPGDSWKWAIY